MAKNNQSRFFLNDPTWYKDAIIYQVHVKSYFDSNNDGVGDFAGLITKLDYIAELGVNAIWLLPFYPSPMRDDGYDIADYRAIEPSYGTMSEARQFIQEAHKRGIRVITELVINHTSDQHPWFQKARRAKKGSKAREFYVWSDTDKKYEGTRIIFSDTESSNWTWDPVAEQYFWHRFYSNQPDLNFDNPDVLKEVLSIMRFWFDMGVDGLRLDAIPYLVEREGTANENLPETHAVLKKIRAELNTHYPDRMLLAEANLWPEDIQQYFGEGDECHMAFHFPLMPRMYMAIAQEDRFPIIDILRQMPEIPRNCQWAIFLRNHDELTLEMVTDQERDYLWNHYANDKRARLNLGIRRRLAPLVERDRRRIELLKSLLLSMPGTPTLYYGDEIGMGDNIFLGDRHGVRTPMQWTNDRNGGFSRADPASLTLPAIMDPLYGFQAINVEAQARDAHSLLNWTRRMLSVRKQHKAFGRGELRMLYPANRRILAYVRDYQHEDSHSQIPGDSLGNTEAQDRNVYNAREIILCVANMSRAAQAAELDLSHYANKIPIEMIGGTLFPVITKSHYQLTLPPYGFFWFLLSDECHLRSGSLPPGEVMPELPTVVIKNNLSEIVLPPAIDLLQGECLPVYLQNCPWFYHRCSSASSSVGSMGQFQLRNPISIKASSGIGGDSYMFAELVSVGKSSDIHHHIALGFVAEHDASTLTKQSTLARLRRKRVAGLLADAFTLPDFNRNLIKMFYEQKEYSEESSTLRFSLKSDAPIINEKELDEIRLVTHQNNLAVVVGASAVIKPVHTFIYGSYPFAELSDFLRSHNYANIIKVFGELQRVDQQGSATLALLQEYLPDQGNAWQWTQNTLERAFRDETTAGTSTMTDQAPALAELESFSKVLGNRLGEMHNVLAQPEAQTFFECGATDNISRWALKIECDLKALSEFCKHHYNAAVAEFADRLEKHSETLSKCLSEKGEQLKSIPVIRNHGNLHLGQILVVRGDAFFGELDDAPLAILESARLSVPPLKDVAAMLLSFDDAAAWAVQNIIDADPLADKDQAHSLAALYRHRAKTAFYNAYQTATQSIPFLWENSDNVALALQFASLENRIHQVLRSTANVAWLQQHLNEVEEKIVHIIGVD